MSEEKQPKVVPARNDFKKQPVFVKATIADQSNARPGYVRQWMHAKDALNKSYYGRYLQAQRLGDPEVGYCTAEPWTVVSRDGAKSGRQRDDDTKGIESAQTHGDLVLMETTEENFAVYQEYDRLRDKAMAKRLSAGDDEAIRDDSGRAVARYRARIGDGSAYDDHNKLLNEGT